MPFQPGNTLGRGRPPAGKSLTEALRIALAEKLPDGRTNHRAIADVLVERARGGDIAAIREILDRTEGKVPTTAKIESGRAAAPLSFTILPIDQGLL